MTCAFDKIGMKMERKWIDKQSVSMVNYHILQNWVFLQQMSNDE
jgi:hypothetical protein